jgi:hypothetical protein
LRCDDGWGDAAEASKLSHENDRFPDTPDGSFQREQMRNVMERKRILLLQYHGTHFRHFAPERA